MVINAMKVFDIVFVMGSAGDPRNGGDRRTHDPTGSSSQHDGRGAAIAVVLFVAIIPVMLWNIRRFREQEEIR